VPLFMAEFVVWLGFGAFLPILPLYLSSRGIDFATLGLIVAAWPAARLIAEPAFGWVADRTARKPLMVAALVANAIALPLPLFVSGAAAFIVLRAFVGLATAAYDPAARGFLVDATPGDRQGEAFGLYGAAQMSGLLFGPAIGGVGASIVGDEAFGFWLAAASSLAAALVIALMVREGRRTRVATGIPAEGVAELPGSPLTVGPASPTASEGPTEHGGQRQPRSLVNRLLIAAIVVNVGGFFAQGTYEVVWSLYLTGLGASLELVGATFAAFAVPVLLFSPAAGRSVDRRGALAFIVVGTVMLALAGIAYTLIRDPFLAIPLILFEATGSAVLFPALYAVVAAGSPTGRSSTAQGLFGAAGTLGFIVASLIAGQLAAIDIRYPFWMFVVVSLVSLGIGLAVGGGPLRSLHSGADPSERVPSTTVGAPVEE
jgi:MFS family permease